MKNHISRKLAAGEVLKPWLVAGPVYRDMSGKLDERTFFENSRCDVGRDVLAEFLKQMGAELAEASPRENDSVCLPGGAEAQWYYLDTPEKYTGFGQYFVTNHLGCILAHQQLISHEMQQVVLRLGSRLSAWGSLWCNGKLLWDGELEGEQKPVQIQVPLIQGENQLTLLMARIARMAEVGWCLELVSSEAALESECSLSMDSALRQEIEHSIQHTCMEEDTYGENNPVYLHVGAYDAAWFRVEIQLQNGPCIDGRGGGRFLISEGLLPGSYTVTVRWFVGEQEIAKREFPLTICHVFEPLPGKAAFEKRRQIFLRACAALVPEEHERDRADILWARYALGQYDRISYEQIDRACQVVDRRDDCADFTLLPLLRIVYAERGEVHLPETYMERIRQAALGFKYWVDEANDCMMWFDSENHRMGFHTLEYLAGLLFPQDIFTNSGQNGLFHSMKGRMHLMEWLSQRIRFGLNEFHSDSYIPITLGPLLALQEMTPYEEFSIRTMATELTHLIVFYLAVNQYHGAIASPRGRSYNLPMRNPFQQGTTSILYLLFGEDAAALKIEPGVMSIAVDGYQPPEGILQAASHYEETHFRYKSGLYHTGKQNADLTAMRTPEYMISSVRNHNVGACEAHLHVAQITLPKDTIIFFSAPFTMREGSGLRPDYWAGQASVPQVYQYRNTLCVRWQHVQHPYVWMTHCHLDTRRLDKYQHRGNWTFGRVGESYVGIWSWKPHVLCDTGAYAMRELISQGNENCWIAECGSKREDGSFEAFIDRLEHAHIEVKEECVVYESPKNHHMCFGEPFLVQGEEIPVGNMAVDCPYLRSRYGSGTYESKLAGWDGIIWSYASSI